MPATTLLPVGSPVVVLGNPCSVRTCIGLFGYVTRVFPEEGKMMVQLLGSPTLDDEAEVREEKGGRFRTWSATVAPADVHLLPSYDERVPRIRALEACERKDRAMPEDPTVKALMEEMGSASARRADAEERAAIAAESARIGRVFELPGVISRGDKSRFPAFGDPVTEKISDELRGYAQKGPSKCSLTERARWGQALAATNATAFWSGRAEVRALIKELDLDPMVDEFNRALYRNREDVFVLRADLRKVAITLWNAGAVFLQIQDMESADTCWASYKKGEPTGFLITYAFRRMLPWIA